MVEVPRKLVYTWSIDDGGGETSLVTVQFEPRGGDTEIIVVHEDLPSEAVRESHAAGWTGCLDGIDRLFAAG